MSNLRSVLVISLACLATIAGCGDDSQESAPTSVDTIQPAGGELGPGIVTCELVQNDESSGLPPTAQLSSWDVETGESTGYVDLSHGAALPDTAEPSVAGLGIQPVSMTMCGADDTVQANSPSIMALLGPTIDVDQNLLAATTVDEERPSAGVIDLRTGEFRNLSGLAEVDDDAFVTSDVRDHSPTFDPETGDLVWLRSTGGDTGDEFVVMRAPVDGVDPASEVEAEVSVNEYTEYSGNLFTDGDVFSDQSILRQPDSDRALCCAIDYWNDGLLGPLYSVCEIVDGVIDWRETVDYGQLYPNCDYLNEGAAEESYIEAIGWLADGTLVDMHLDRWSYSPDAAEGTPSVSLIGSLIPESSRDVQGIAVGPSGDSVLMIADGEFWIVSTDGGEPRRLDGIPVAQVVAWT